MTHRGSELPTHDRGAGGDRGSELPTRGLGVALAAIIVISGVLLAIYQLVTA